MSCITFAVARSTGQIRVVVNGISAKSMLHFLFSICGQGIDVIVPDKHFEVECGDPIISSETVIAEIVQQDGLEPTVVFITLPVHEISDKIIGRLADLLTRIGAQYSGSKVFNG